MTLAYIIKKSKASGTTHGNEELSSIYIRFRDGRAVDSTCVTPFAVKPNLWDAKRETVKTRVVCNEEERAKLVDSLNDLREFLIQKYEVDKPLDKITKTWLSRSIDEFIRKGPKKQRKKKVVDANRFQSRFQEFIEAKEFTQEREGQYRVVERAVLRFEQFCRLTKPHGSRYTFDIRQVDENDLSELYDFMENEHIYYEKYPEIYEKFPEKRQSRPRGANTLANNFKKLRAFFHWCSDEGYIQVSPFTRFKFEGEMYGTPYYLTKDELHLILDTDFSDEPYMEIQRDVFVFQCCIGCRVGDLMRLKKSDVIDGAIEYIPTKTISDRANTVRVPLNDTAYSILEKYKDYDDKERLLPFISSQKYNDYIKGILTRCGITRLVTRLNSLTRREEKVPINEVASSHMARRTFIANIYNKVQDPNLISSLTGHVEGSKAFCRYRTVEEKVKKDLVDILD